jgi:branched-chain amino acid transport system ATP-binding protein
MSESSTHSNGTQPIPLLNVEGLVQRFGGVTAVDNVSLTVALGEVHGIIGPNGAGKTTLFDCIAGLCPPTSGTIFLEGRDVTNSSAVKRARLGLRRTFQRQQVFGWLSVEDNVLLAMEWRGGGGGIFGDAFRLPGRVRRERDRRERVVIALERCGLTKVRDESAGGLSIGALRRVELARAIVDEPVLLLLDEPTSGLEDADIDQLGEIIQDLRARGTCATLLIEHHVPFAIQHCDRISVLELGRKIASGSPDDVMQDESVRQAYLA